MGNIWMLINLFVSHVCLLLIIQCKYCHFTLNYVLDYLFVVADKFTNNVSSKLQLQEMTDVTEMLQFSSKQIFDFFSMVTLSSFCSIFIGLIDALFWITDEGLQNNVQMRIFLYYYILWTGFLISLLLNVIALTHRIEMKSKRLVENIYDVRVRMGRKVLPYKSMGLFLMKARHNSLNFSVCGLFRLEWSLIYSMIAGITTYSVYLIQFREMERARSGILYSKPEA